MARGSFEPAERAAAANAGGASRWHAAVIGPACLRLASAEMNNPQEHTHFLVETIWVMFTYGTWQLAAGMAISSVVVFWASRCVRLRFRLPILFAAILVLWIAMFIAADSGYRAWQSTPNPPEEAFSDTGPILFLLAGWLPGTAIAYLLLRICRWISPRSLNAPTE